MSKLRSLASQTAVYGVSSILGRLLTYALVPLHTSIFGKAEMGTVTVLYGYVGMFLVVYTFGMETTFFRFANKDDLKKTLSQTGTFVIALSSLVTIGILLGAGSLIGLESVPGNAVYLQWLAVALWIDAILAIPFAMMRFENKAKVFATTKLINIFLTVGLQLIFLLLIPYLQDHGHEWLDFVPELGIGYIFLTNLVSNLFLLFLLRKWVFKIQIAWPEWSSFRPLLIYATPIMITGLAGILNEQLDKILINDILPNDFYSDSNSLEAAGVYGQLFKLSVFMLLGIQAFRYAAEPFFFTQAKDKKAPELFSRVMHYFVLSCLAVLVLVTVNVDLIAYIFLRDKVFRVALYIVPVLLTGKLFYGIYMNLSIWFKLTDKTQYGTYFSLLGVIVTIVGNVLLIPIIGFVGSAWTSVACYFVMAVVCYYYGQKYYPIPYKFQKLLGYALAAGLLVAGSLQFHHPDFIMDSILRIVVSVIILGAIILIERRNLQKSRLIG